MPLDPVGRFYFESDSAAFRFSTLCLLTEYSTERVVFSSLQKKEDGERKKRGLGEFVRYDTKVLAM